MLTEVADLLRCPLCFEPFAVVDAALRCASGHSFDIARQGYVNLLPGDARPGTADTREMVAAREEFLGAGHYAPLVDALARVAARYVPPDAPGCMVDVGAGAGFYTSAVLAVLPGRWGLALDISKHAARRAARASARVQAVVCDAWSALPVRTGAAALVLDVFAPRNAAEFRRVLGPEGVLVVVTPTARHLAELVAALPMVTVDPEKDERLADKLGADFTRLEARTVEAVLRLTHPEIALLVSMGPTARHLRPGELSSLVAALPETVPVTLSVTVSVLRPL